MKDRNGNALQAGDTVKLMGGSTTRNVLDIPNDLVCVNSTISVSGYTWFNSADVEKIEPAVLDRLGVPIEVGDRVYHTTRKYTYTVAGFSKSGDVQTVDGFGFFSYNVVVLKNI